VEDIMLGCEGSDTAVEDGNGVATVTCPGGPPTAFTESCGYSTILVDVAFATTSPACTDGTCSF
jgi:hypothetical protein